MIISLTVVSTYCTHGISKHILVFDDAIYFLYYFYIVLLYSMTYLVIWIPYCINVQDMCAPYWPDDVGKSLQFNDYIIELVESKKYEDYIQREFKLTKEKVSVL